MPDKFVQQLAEWDQFIKEGQVLKVKQLCNELNHKLIPRHLLIEYAQIARRIGAPNLIIFWFNSIIRSDKILQQKPSDQEKAIYALGLLRLGAFNEAKQILYEIDSTADPQVRFYRASLHLNQWNFRKAIPELKKYIKDKKVTDYQKLVGQLNLCAALVSNENIKQAEKEIAKLLKKLTFNKLTLLKGNLLELRSQLYSEQKKFNLALADLMEAENLLQRADEKSQLLVNKSKAVIKIKSEKNKNEALSNLQQVKTQAIKINEWEIVRDCDLHLAINSKDQRLMKKIYWGTLFNTYKNRILKLFDVSDFNTLEYVWSNQLDNIATPPFEIDLVKAAPTLIIKKLFFILTREFYRPLRTTELFDSIYRGEFYNPKSGPEKMHRLVARARKWLCEHNIPVEIKSFRNGYKLELIGNVNLKLHRHFLSEEKLKVPEELTDKKFTTKDWQQKYNISSRTARRQILKLVKNGEIESYVRGPKTFYKAS